MNDSELTMNVALVRRLMDERGWTWSHLAKQMGMSKSTVSRVANFDKLPGRKFIFALQQAFPGQDDLFVPAAQAGPPAWEYRLADTDDLPDTDEPAA